MSLTLPYPPAGSAKSEVNTSETTTSTSYVDLATVQSCTVVVGSSGLLLVGWGAQMSNSVTGGAYCVPALSGANTYAASDNDLLYTASATVGIGKSKLFTGLTPGSTTITLKFRVDATTGTFLRRVVWAVPL